MAVIHIHLFGTGRFQRADGGLVPIRTRKQLALLSFLLLEAPQIHSREALMALLWPEFDINTARNNLRVTLSTLRSTISQLFNGIDLIQANRFDVQLNPEAEYTLDVARFNGLLRRTRQHDHAQRGACASCHTHLQQAVALYQQELLAGFALDDCPDFEGWLLMQRERLRFLALGAYQDLATFAETNADLTAARTFTEGQLELDPLCESAHRQQMRILAKLGQRSAALDAFERGRTLLRKELGIEPEPETLALQLRILNDGMSENGSNPSNTLAHTVASTGASHHNLPQQLTSFIGRQEELDLLHTHLVVPTNRLLSIVGPGGIGKSRLAQQVAAQHLPHFRDGVFLIALAQVSTVESIPAAIAETLGFSFIAGQKSATQQLIEAIGEKQLLLVLDNFEHLMGGIDLLLALLQQTPNVVLLVTTRERLNLQAEDLFELRGLPVPTHMTNAADFAAVQLFAKRAHRLDKSFALTQAQLPHVVRICQLVEGFPLAIELAATWLRDLTCAEIVAELSAGLDRLQTSLRDIDPHHRSLRSVFDSSWRLLSPEEQHALARLTVFSGGFSQNAALAIASASPRLLRALRDKSLLRHTGSQRYDMHMLIHQFAAEYLGIDEAAAAHTQHAHSRYFLALLAEHALPLDTHEAAAAADRIQMDWDNVVAAWRGAVARGDRAALDAALEGLVRFCDLRGHILEVELLLKVAADRFEQEPKKEPKTSDPADKRLYCRVLTALAYFAGRRQAHATIELAQSALALAIQLDSKIEIITNYITQADAFEVAADYSQAGTLAERALAIAQQEQLDVQIGLCLHSLGITSLHSGDYARARHLFQEVWAIHERTGCLEQCGHEALGRLGILAAEQGRYGTALEYEQRYLDNCMRMHDKRNTAHAQHHLAFLSLKLGNFTRVLELESQSILHSIDLGDREQLSFSLHNKARAHRHLGQMQDALACATEAVIHARAVDASLGVAFALAQLAEVQLEVAQTEVDWAQAAANFEEAATIARTIGKLIVALEVETGLAALALRRGMWASAHARVLPLLPHLPTGAADGWDEPMRAYVVCIRALRAVNDPLADVILEQGQQLLDALADNITHPELRRTFLYGVPAHNELRALRREEEHCIITC